jgi:flagellin
MSTINTNVPAVTAQRHLLVSQRALAQSLERLSSGLKINRGADDPAGLIVSERLRSEIEAVAQSIGNSVRAINVIATTEGALDEVSALLVDIQGLIVEAANTGAFSDEEIEANQLQIDSAIESISRIANTTTFAGRKLLNGELDYVTSGVVDADLRDVNVLAAKFGTRQFIPVEISVTQSAQTAVLHYATSAIPDGTGSVTITLGGPDGIVTLTFPASATGNAMAAMINGQIDATGVSAVASAAGLNLSTREFGSDAFVSVQPVAGSPDFPVQDMDGVTVRRDEGRDAQASINGASTIANGLNVKISDPFLKLEMTLDPEYNNGAGTGTSSFAVVEGGALFQLGPQVNTNLQENIGVKAMHPERLGSALIGYLSDLKSGQRYSLRNLKQTQSFKSASDIITTVIDQVTVLRGRLGAFERNTLQTNINQLQITMENLTSSESVIRDTNFAEETSELTRAQILVQAGNSILAIANAQSQNVLSLLGG